MKKICVYAFKNKIYNKSYIGSTKDVKERYWSHISKLKRGVHDNKELQQDFDLLGRDAFEMVILEECSVENLLQKEQYWSDAINDKYNIRKLVISNKGVGHSESVKKVLSAKRKGENNPFYGKKHSEQTKLKISRKGGESKKSKLVVDLNTGIFYDCAREAGEAYNIKNSYIIGMLNGTNKNKTNLKYA
jgi:group I intron endonuclease